LFQPDPIWASQNSGIAIEGDIEGGPLNLDAPNYSLRPLGPNRVVIWRSFSLSEAAAMNEKGVLVGLAYLKTDNGVYFFIRKVDLIHSDVELAKEFGVELKK
jgi:hypothetical protein